MTTISEKRRLLEEHGFVVGVRDPRINTNHQGRFMVAENYEASELPTEDGRNGPWCIVGNNMTDLVERAYDDWSDSWSAKS